MERSKLLKRLYLLKTKPELYRDLSNEELADFVRIVLMQVEAIDKAIKDGVHDGYTPKKGLDYIGREEAIEMLKTAFTNELSNFNKKAGEKHGAIELAVNKRLAQLQNGKNGEDALITEDMLHEIASRAYDLIELPNFEALITQEPKAIRDALELLQGNERLSITAIDGLEERLTGANRNDGSNRIGATVARKLGTIGDVKVEGVTDGQTLIYQASTKTWIPGTPSGGPGGSFTLLTPTEPPDGSRTQFTVTGHPQLVFANSSIYIEGFGFTYAALQITLTIPPDGGTPIRYVV